MAKRTHAPREDPGRGGPSDDRGERPRNRPNHGRERRARLERRINCRVRHEGGERDSRGEQVDADAEQHEAAERHHGREHERLRRLQPPVRKGPQPRAPHETIRVPLDDLVEGRCAAGDECRAAHCEATRAALKIAAAHHVSHSRRRDNEQVQPRLRQRDEVARAAPNVRPRDRPGLDAFGHRLHGRTPSCVPTTGLGTLGLDACVTRPGSRTLEPQR